MKRTPISLGTSIFCLLAAFSQVGFAAGNPMVQQVKATQRELAAINAEINSLENRVVALRHELKMNRGSSLGSKEDRETLLATREQQLTEARAEKAARFAPEADHYAKIFADKSRYDADYEQQAAKFLNSRKQMPRIELAVKGKIGKFGALGAAALVPIAAEAMAGGSNAEAKSLDEGFANEQKIEPAAVDVSNLDAGVSAELPE